MSHHFAGHKGKSQGRRRLAMRAGAFLTGLVTTAGFAAGFAIPASAAARPHAVSTANMGFTPLAPTCITDTRAASASPACATNNGKTLTPGGMLTVDVPSSVPAGAGAVVVSVDIIHPTGSGFASVFPAGQSFGGTANVNFVPGQTVDNIVTTGLGTDSTTGSPAFTIYDGPATGTGGNFDVQVDLEGYYMTNAGSAYNGLTPVRADDTRSAAADCGAAGTSACPNAGKTLGAGTNPESVNVQVAGVDGVPSTATAVSLNLALTNASGGTSAAPNFIEAYPTGQTQPLVANQNYVAGETLSTQVVVGVGTGGDVTIANNAGSTDVIVDINGYFTSTGSYLNMLTSPTRLTASSGNSVAGGSSTSVTLSGTGANAGVLNLAEVYQATAGGNFLTAFPTGATQPVAANLNYTTGDVSNVLSNGAYAASSSSGGVTVANGPATAGTALVFVDESGYFAPQPSSGVFVSASPSSIAANGTSTSTVTATVRKGGAVVSGDQVSFTVSPSTCGALNPLTAVTNTSGVATTTYTSSTTQGTCTVTAAEANSGMTGATSIVQTAPSNTVAMTASVNPVAANGATASSITATVTNASGTAVSGDTVTFSEAPSPAGACGTLSPTSGTTNSSGVVVVSYLSSTTSGFCTITGTESASGGSSSVVIDQTTSPAPAGYTVTVTPNPASIGATGTSTSTITALVQNATPAPVAGDTVLFTVAPATCGTFSSATAKTNASGDAVVTYTSSTTAEACVVTAKEANAGVSGNNTVTQTAADILTVTASPSSIPATGTSSSTVTVTDTTSSGAPVAGKVIGFAGGTGSFSGAPCTTNASGQCSVAYISSTTPGFETITATETTAPSSSGTVTIDQTKSPAPSNTPYVVSVAASPASIAADGATTSTVTVTVKDSTGAAVSGDPIAFSLPSPKPASCGTLSTLNGVSNTSGQATTTYTASATPGSCTVTGAEAYDGQSGTGTVTQTSPLNTVTMAASVNPVAANGATASSITATVTNAGGTAVSGDTVTFSLAPSPAGACGTLSPTSGTTNSSGVVVVSYLSSTTSGFCTITGTESASGGTGKVVMTQTQSPAPGSAYTVTVTPAAPSLAANGKTTQSITATVDNATPAPVAGDPVMFTLTPSVAGACGTLSSMTGTTNAAGQVVVTYTTSTTAGTCTISAEEANEGHSGNTVVTQTASDIVTVGANPSSIPANGTSTSTITVTDTTGGGAPVAGVTITFSVTPGGGTFSSGGTCTTNASGTCSVVYISSTTAGFYTITGLETAGGTGSSGNVTVDQTTP